MAQNRTNSNASRRLLKQSVNSSSKSRQKSTKTTTQKASCTQKSSAVLTRILFLLHASIALWRVWLIYPHYYMYFLSIGIACLLVEMVFTLAVRQGNEYKWFCPSVFFYLLSVVPCLWLLELGILDQFAQQPVIDGGCYVQEPKVQLISVNQTANSTNTELKRSSRDLHSQLYVLPQNETSNISNSSSSTTTTTKITLLNTTYQGTTVQELSTMKVKKGNMATEKNQNRAHESTTFSAHVSPVVLVTDTMKTKSTLFSAVDNLTSNNFHSETPVSTSNFPSGPITTSNTLNKMQEKSTEYNQPLSKYESPYPYTSGRTAKYYMPDQTATISTDKTGQVRYQTNITENYTQSTWRQTTFYKLVTTYTTKLPERQEVGSAKISTNGDTITNFHTTTLSTILEVTKNENLYSTTKKQFLKTTVRTNNHSGLQNLGDKITKFGKNTFSILKNTTDKVNEFLEKLDPETWLLALHQVLLFVLVIGRWLLPKGEITRDQLSQLLLVFIGVGADILEFVTETINNDSVDARCNVLMHYTIYSVWSWSLLQFTLVLTAAKSRKTRVGFSSDRVTMMTKRKTCCTGTIFNNADVWGIIVTMMVQDVPFLAFRLYIMIVYEQVHQMMIFFTGKNILVVCLQVYRLIVLQIENKIPKTNDDLNASELTPLKGTLERLTSQSSTSSISEGDIKNATFKTRNDGSVVVKIYLENEAAMKKKLKSRSQ